jgi:hypothetical protein
LEFIWDLGFGIWNLEFGIWDFPAKVGILVRQATSSKPRFAWVKQRVFAATHASGGLTAAGIGAADGAVAAYILAAGGG